MKRENRKGGYMRLGVKIFLIAIIIIASVAAYGAYSFGLEFMNNNRWLVEEQFRPLQQFGLHDESWCYIVATDEFSSKDLKERLEAANKQFEHMRPFVTYGHLGYDKKEVENWFLGTAINYKEYPIKTFQLTHGGIGKYRDFGNSIPHPKYKNPFIYLLVRRPK